VFLLSVEYTRERQEHQQTFAKEDQRVIEETEHAASRGVSVNKKPIDPGETPGAIGLASTAESKSS
jgi:hypothetical protein